MAGSGIPCFIVDANAGKLVGWLRLMGYDTLFFDRGEDRAMVNRALAENRVILTRDTRIGQRRLVKEGILKAVILTSDSPQEQIKHVFKALGLDPCYNPFTLCLVCNTPLEDRSRAEVKELVPPYVYKTQSAFRQCPNCRRIYWRGTHWQALNRRLAEWREESSLQD